MLNSFPVNLGHIQEALERIRPHTALTPCLMNERLSQACGCEVFLKAENLQHVAAFKARGALNAVLQLSEDQAACGVVTHSSGNHAAALARAAKLRGIEAHVVMPRNSAQTKINAVRSLGVEPIFCEPDTPAREAAAANIQEKTGATLIHPFNNPHVIAGQGTVALEILEQVEQVDHIIAPIGGGGLISGILLAANALAPSVSVYGAEPAWADDAYRSLKSGQMELPNRYDSVADGLRSSLGDLTFPVIQSLVEEILLVTEPCLLNSMRKITEEAKLVVEPSAAVSFGALVSHLEKFQNQRVVCVLTGGNLDFGDCRLGS